MVTVISRGAGVQTPPASQGEYAIDSSSEYAIDKNGETALGVE